MYIQKYIITTTRMTKVNDSGNVNTVTVAHLDSACSAHKIYQQVPQFESRRRRRRFLPQRGFAHEFNRLWS